MFRSQRARRIVGYGGLGVAVALGLLAGGHWVLDLPWSDMLMVLVYAFASSGVGLGLVGVAYGVNCWVHKGHR